jgi:hypothetical protein
MTPIDFPQRNLMLAEDQPEYQTLPVFVDSREYKSPEGSKVIPWAMTCVFELSDDEIAELQKTKKLFYRQSLYGHNFQPMFFSTKDPFIPENAQHWPAE